MKYFSHKKIDYWFSIFNQETIAVLKLKKKEEEGHIKLYWQFTRCDFNKYKSLTEKKKTRKFYKSNFCVCYLFTKLFFKWKIEFVRMLSAFDFFFYKKKYGINFHKLLYINNYFQGCGCQQIRVRNAGFDIVQVA